MIMRWVLLFTIFSLLLLGCGRFIQVKNGYQVVPDQLSYDQRLCLQQANAIYPVRPVFVSTTSSYSDGVDRRQMRQMQTVSGYEDANVGIRSQYYDQCMYQLGYRTILVSD
jgi:hypothetical protein